MSGRKVAIFNCAHGLSDNEIYIMQVFDNAPSGLLVKAYLQARSLEYYMPITELELEKAGLNRTEPSLAKLTASIDLIERGGVAVLQSSIPGIIKPKIVPTGGGVRQFISRTKAGNEALPEFLTKALSELCKEKPVGLNATKWLGNWMLLNNPNQPKVDEPIDAAPSLPQEKMPS